MVGAKQLYWCLTVGFSVERAMMLQKILSEKALLSIRESTRLDLSKIRFIAGFDSAYKDSKQYAAIVIYDTNTRDVVEKTFSIVEARVPYIPGLLAFREVPGYMRAYSKLTVKPDVILVDGHGLTHPRAFGIATHVGVVLGKPSIGVAKKKLYGEIVESYGRRLIRAHGLVVGEVLKHGSTELYVSIGYRVNLEDAVNIVKNLLTKEAKLPIPLQAADSYSKTLKRKY
ncbi:MAG: endonuclease V [Thermosphaera sp.]